MDQTTLRLARIAHDMDTASMPEATIHACKRRIIDSIACAVGAFDEPFCNSMQAFAARYTGQRVARIWGTGQCSSPEMAGFANGTMVRYLDLNDTHLGKTAGHPSDMIAGLLSLAEGMNADGRTLLAGIVAAYEIYCGMCDATALAAHGLDQSVCAALGAACGASRVLHLSVERTANALALALAANLNLYNVRCGTLSDWKACAGPNATRNGVFAAILASEGVSGPTAVFEGQGGLFDVVSNFEFALGQGGAPLIAKTHLKFHPVCYHGQVSVDVAAVLHGCVPLEQVSEIRVETYETAVNAMAADPSRWAPTTRETADHSLPYTVAVTLEAGRLIPADYRRIRITDPFLRDLMAKVQVLSRDDFSRVYPGKSQARITIRTEAGEEFSAERSQPKGHAENPLSDAELETKLAALVPARLGARAARRLLDLVWALDGAASVTPIVDALVFESCR